MKLLKRLLLSAYCSFEFLENSSLPLFEFFHERSFDPVGVVDVEFFLLRTLVKVVRDGSLMRQLDLLDLLLVTLQFFSFSPLPLSSLFGQLLFDLT